MMQRILPEAVVATGRKRSDPSGDRRLLWLAIAIWTGFIVLEALIDPGMLPMGLVWAAHGLALMMILKACLDRAPRKGWKRVALFVGLTILVACVQTALDLAGTIFVGPTLLSGLEKAPDGIKVSPVGMNPFLVFKISLRSYLWIYGLYAAAFSLQAVARGEQEAREESYRARLRTQRAELDALRLQVNPHFLFNALNGIASLAGTEQGRRTETMALSLARYYRSSFVDIERDVIPLQVELEAVQDYLDLETHRLEMLRFELDCPEDLLDAQVPPMILQPLIENAVKYGVAGHASPAPIRVEVRRVGERLNLVCESGLSPNPDPSGTGSGLVTLRRRLEKAFGERASLRMDGDDQRWRAIIEMPLTIAEEPAAMDTEAAH